MKQRNMHGSQFGGMDKNQQRSFLKFVNTATNENPTRSREIHDLMGMLEDQFGELQEQMRSGQRTGQMQRLEDVGSLRKARTAEQQRAERLEQQVKNLAETIKSSANVGPQRLRNLEQTLARMTENRNQSNQRLAEIDRRITSAQARTAPQGTAGRTQSPPAPPRPRTPKT